MKSLDQQLKDIMKKVEKKVNKETQKIIKTNNEKIARMPKGENSMGFNLLDSESEDLLNEILNNQKEFPKVLRTMFYKEDDHEIDYEEDTILRSKIKCLMDAGLITINWADNVPYFGRIEQKGRTYFEMKAKYEIMQKGAITMNFVPLDIESEETLKKLLLENEKSYFIVNTIYSPIVIQNLIELGYLQSKNGVQRFIGEGWVCCALLTQKAKTYEETKNSYEKMLEMQKPIQNQYNGPITAGFVGCTNLTNCTSIVGDNASIQQDWSTNYEYVSKSMDEIKNNLEKYGLTEIQKQEITDIVNDIQEITSNKKPTLIKIAIKGLFCFAKDVGCQLLASFLAVKFGIMGV